ncbi:hypothetical protein LTR97_012143 [Elasticomyces elasticus]|uniref:F-box domain-containing protein n=1 Tax=Elasticomyces elasticus TaxID=574655 RepID=A0AAN7VZ93_9PEZI|nr:hypothetical protein LTR97_012143 [Elasticomyces elasticus]
MSASLGIGKGKRVHTASDVPQESPKKRSRQAEATRPQTGSQRDCINKAIQAMGEMVVGEIRERMMGGFHNHDLATNGRNLLLSLPKEVRLNIFRLAVIDTLPIMVDHLVDACAPTPGLLTVSKQVREESAAFYYKRNNFVFRVTDWNVLRYSTIVKKFKTSRKSSPDNLAPTLWLLGVPNWANLMMWCREVFHRRMPGYDAKAGPNDLAMMTCSTMFDVVGRLKEDARADWKTAEKVLLTFRPLLVMMDGAWAL